MAPSCSLVVVARWRVEEVVDDRWMDDVVKEIGSDGLGWWFVGKVGVCHSRCGGAMRFDTPVVRTIRRRALAQSHNFGMRCFKVLSCLAVASVARACFDEFNYGESVVEQSPDGSYFHNFGPKDWGLVDCHDVDSCPGWPTNWEDYNSYIPFDGTSNMCQHCVDANDPACSDSMQSPIDLTTWVTGDRKCNDRHRMNYQPGSCFFGRLDFQILPHVLRVVQPDFCHSTPNIDFSRGYPDPWLLSFTDISVPSQHTIEGHRFAAEVVLSHTYSVANRTDRLIGNVAIMLERGTDDDHYDFLELYLRAWKRKAKQIRDACNGRRKMQQQNLRRMELGPQLIEKSYFNRTYQPYDWYVKTDTEYYFRYLGTMAEPPCFHGVHWRVLRKPVYVAPKQMDDLYKLIRDQLDPETCEKSTAGAPLWPGSNRVGVNRPIQQVTDAHELVYCECQDWGSASDVDQDYCELEPEDRGVVILPSPMPSNAPSDSPSGSPSST